MRNYTILLELQVSKTQPTHSYPLNDLKLEENQVEEIAIINYIASSRIIQLLWILLRSN